MLNNNSNEMKTAVETFLIEETVELIYDNEKLDKWNELVDKLNLNGQTRIVAKDKSPIPFLHLNTSMVNIFKTLCPRQVNVTDYDVTPIPVEILNLISLSVNEEYFNKIEIWYDEKSPDPACIGTTGYYYQTTWYDDRDRSFDNVKFKTRKECLDAGIKDKNINFSEDKKYLLGKWADVKHTFEQLKTMAMKRYKLQEEHELKKRIKDAQRELDDLESKTFERFN
jgi:hypothetical protein